MSGLPRQEQCDMDDPEERFLWMLVGLPIPGQDGAGGLMLDKATAKRWSKALSDRGAVFDPEAQKSWYHPPANGSWWAGGGGQWKDHPPEIDEKLDKVLGAMTAEQRAEMRRRLDDMEGE